MQYTIRQGDTLYRLAQRFGVSIQAIMSANPRLRLSDYLIPGEVIIIPLAGPRRYVIQPGDTLYLISRRTGIPLQQLIAANPQIRPEQLQVGQVIVLPAGDADSIVQTDAEYGYEEMQSDISALIQRYPFLRTEVIGRSVFGREIAAIRLGTGSKEVFYSASWHANEWITTPLLMKFVEEFAKAYQTGSTIRGYDIQAIFRIASIWIVPLVNPDGVELVQEGITAAGAMAEQVLAINDGMRDFRGWSANIRGVDLNHQWPADWEREASVSPQEPSPRKYGGPRPLSEPETQAIYQFTIRHNFLTVLAFHSQGQVIYWGFKGLEPPESERIVRRLGVLSGYEPIRTAESAAGYKDWFIQQYRRTGFTVEVGVGTNPLPIEQFPMIWNRTLGILLEAPLLV